MESKRGMEAALEEGVEAEEDMSACPGDITISRSRISPTDESEELGLVRPAAPQARALRVFRSGEHVDLVLRPQRIYSFGRADNVEICVRHPNVSRFHGMLRASDSGWTYSDLGSSNGSFVFSLEEYENYLGTGGTLPVNRLGPHQSIILQPGRGVALGTLRAAFGLLEEVPKSALDRSVSSDTCRSKVARRLEENIEMAAQSSVPVFLLGASGVGKTFAANRIHERSGLSGPFVPVNCAGLPDDPSMLRSELLGHVRGAFTGAESDRVGRLRLADRGTLFLDEVESMPPAAQGFLLDILDESRGALAPLGAQPHQKYAVPRFRLISASKVPLMHTPLRKDLCGRLEGLAFRVPGLEERREDIPGLVSVFQEKLRGEWGIETRLSEEAVRLLSEAAWPLQVRQLERAIQAIAYQAKFRAERTKAGGRIVVSEREVRQFLEERENVLGICAIPLWYGDGGPTSISDHRSPALTEPPRPMKSPRHLNEEDLRRALELSGGNKTAAAVRLGIARNTLLRKLRELEMDR